MSFRGKSIALVLLLVVMLSGCLGGGAGKSGPKFNLEVYVSGQGSVNPKAGATSIPSDTLVTIEAIPASGWEFSYWIGDVSDPYSPKTEIMMDEDKSVTAVMYSEEESIFFETKDSSGAIVPGVSLMLTDSTGSVTTNSRGFAVVNTTAASTIVTGVMDGFVVEPTPLVVQKGDRISFTLSEGSVPRVFTAELTINHTVFKDTAKLNPFSSAKIREAMNWLIDREYIVSSIYTDHSPLTTVVVPDTFEYELMLDTIEALEQKYSFDAAKAEAVIHAEMEQLGAELVGGIWHYKDEPVEVKFLIRDDEVRTKLGDYIADQLENVGFAVERIYLNGGQAAPIWMNGDPTDGEWNLYTGGWMVSKNYLSHHLLKQFHTPGSLGRLGEAYTHNPELIEVVDRLNGPFNSVEERKEVLKQSLELSLQDSVRVWLVYQ